MCTLTYLPLASGPFYLTSNRDESPLRARAHSPEIQAIGQREVVFPRDGKAGGTWIAVSNDRRTVCLLNGAFGRHPMGGTYRLSRGIVVLDSLAYPDFEGFADGYDFEGIEPFTFVDLAEQGGAIQIRELRWDGRDAHRARYDGQKPQIWSSAQLYKPEVIRRREKWFMQWLAQHPHCTLADIQAFHHFGGEGDIYNDIRMNRDGLVQTVSTTAVVNGPDEVRMEYEDLLSGQVHRRSLAVARA